MHHKHSIYHREFMTTTLIVAANILAVLWLAFSVTASAESLFRANAQYTENNTYRPHSWFTQPLPHGVGDTLTIIINETQTMTNTSDLTVERTQEINENGSSFFNNIIHKIGIPNHWSVPTLNGIENNNELESSATASRTSQLVDNITVQVVQVLPNGNLIVQGNKTTLINKDTVNMQVTGIVNPFYLDSSNQIASSQVGNFQLLMGGKGVLTRQQTDGIYNKIFRFFH